MPRVRATRIGGERPPCPTIGHSPKTPLPSLGKSFESSEGANPVSYQILCAPQSYHNSEVEIIALSLGAERVPHLSLDTAGRTDSIAFSPGERVSRSGAFTSRSGTGEGSLPQFRESTSSPAPRSSIAVQSNRTMQPGFAGETDGEPLASEAGRATRTMSRFELRFGFAARGGPRGQRETIADAKLWPDNIVCERKKPLTRPATAGESAIVGHPLPTGEGYDFDFTPVSSRRGGSRPAPMDRVTIPMPGRGVYCYPRFG